ncbi:MAG: hypothetical protein EBX36_10625 [Planctomycetia bacterium]|nr:hypothetical protein [Planctomycetia bacterium]
MSFRRLNRYLIDQAPEKHIQLAEQVLFGLGLLGPQGHITDLGHRVAQMPCDPRMASWRPDPRSIGVAVSAVVPRLATGPLVVLAAAFLFVCSLVAAPQRGWWSRRRRPAIDVVGPLHRREA